MKIETKLSCGDKVWYYDDGVFTQLTIGQVRFEYTNSTGINDGYVDDNINVAFGNYKPKVGYEEAYMCIETGIGSGSIHHLGKSIYLTREDCELGNKKEIARKEKYEKDRKKEDKERLLREQKRIQEELSRLS